MQDRKLKKGDIVFQWSEESWRSSTIVINERVVTGVKNGELEINGKWVPGRWYTTKRKAYNDYLRHLLGMAKHSQRVYNEAKNKKLKTISTED